MNSPGESQYPPGPHLTHDPVEPPILTLNGEGDTPTHDAESANAHSTTPRDDSSAITLSGQLASPSPTLKTIFPDLETLTASELAERELEEVRFVVPGLLAPGLTVLAGNPKVGKSLLALDLAYSVASGGTFLGHEVNQGEVLFVAMEDSLQRLQLRLAVRHGDGSALPPMRFVLPRMLSIDQLIAIVEAWASATPSASMVIVDTYGRVSSAKGRGESDYAYVHRTLGRLQRVALDQKICVVLVHHNRKAQVEAGDQYDKVHGSMAITGVADTNIIIERDRNQSTTVLSVTGRDVHEREFTYRFDTDTGRGIARRRSRLSGLTVDQIQVLRVIHGGATTPKEIADATGKSTTNVQNFLTRLVQEGVLEKSKHGVYDVTKAVAAELDGHGAPEEE